MKNKLFAILALALLATLNLQPSTLFAQGTAFTYQGQLKDGPAPANGSYDLTFSLFGVSSGGSAVGGPVFNLATGVTNGLFTVSLDFGVGKFTSLARWLEIGVRTNGSGSFVPLTPRQSLTPTPYAIYAASAGVGGGSPWLLNGTDTYYNGGNVGIGTTGPATALEVNGIARSTRSGIAPQYIQLNGGDSGSIKLTAQSPLAAEKNLFIQNLSGEGTPGANNNIQFELGTTAAPSTKMTITRDGSVGIGTTSPQDRLHVFDPAGSVSQRIETGGGVNAWSRTEYANVNGQWNVGTSLGFSGDQLYFHRQGAANIAFAIQPNGDALLQGNLGIGTTTPGAKLHAETGSANTAAIYGNATGAGGVGVYGQGASGAAVFADGNVRQTRDKGGFVKAMLYVAADGTIIRGFNSFLNGAAATTPPCGFTCTRPNSGTYVIDFGFQVSDRFFAITPNTTGTPNLGANFDFRGVTINQIKVYVFDIASNGITDSPFVVIVY